ncbi:MAG: sigma 54-interacting transcriptional regulator [Dinoroseobacter sp.]|nr:sigma 54-interacting transcriptional regulator [Dinoroseobacter sp.]
MQLFGQVRGGLNWSIQDKPGKLELAHGGTLFRVGAEDSPTGIQEKLLHALQVRLVRHVGASREKPIDIRVICSNRY